MQVSFRFRQVEGISFRSTLCYHTVAGTEVLIVFVPHKWSFSCPQVVWTYSVPAPPGPAVPPGTWRVGRRVDIRQHVSPEPSVQEIRAEMPVLGTDKQKSAVCAGIFFDLYGKDAKKAHFVVQMGSVQRIVPGRHLGRIGMP